jgi:hypothetical protein
MRRLHKGAGMVSHEATTNGDPIHEKVASEVDSGSKGLPSSRTCSKSQERRGDTSEISIRDLVADLKAETIEIRNTYDTQGVEIVNLKQQLSGLRAELNA